MCETQEKLKKLKKLNTKIKELQAEYNMIKNSLIVDYFSTSDEFVTDKGLVLATYRLTTKSTFDSKKFKVDYPGMFKQYQKHSEVYTFLLK